MPDALEGNITLNFSKSRVTQGICLEQPQDSEEFEKNRLEKGKRMVLETQFWTLNLRCLVHYHVKTSI